MPPGIRASARSGPCTRAAFRSCAFGDRASLVAATGKPARASLPWKAQTGSASVPLLSAQHRSVGPCLSQIRMFAQLEDSTNSLEAEWHLPKRLRSFGGTWAGNSQRVTDCCKTEAGDSSQLLDSTCRPAITTVEQQMTSNLHWLNCDP